MLRPSPRRTAALPTRRLGDADGIGAPPVIAAAQLLLRRYYVTLRADGSFGERTRAAVLAFQFRAGRRLTGTLTAGDWAALLERHEAAIGSQGNAVRAAQLLLNHRLAAATQLIEDGLFGTGTLMRVQDVQRSAGLPVTTTVDTATFAVLLRPGCNVASLP